MGLDMFAFSVPANEPIRVASTDPEYEWECNPNAEEIMYWRKNNALHGWMELLAEERLGISAGEFNCEHLELEAEDLLRLIADIEGDKLKPTQGFFFGAQSYSEEEKAEDIGWAKEALRLIESGLDIYYCSWW